MLFEVEITLRRDGYDAVQKRELHNAILRAAAETLTAEDIAEAFVSTRDERANAFTRAKKRLVVIGDWNTLSNTASFRDEVDSCADTFARLREYLVEKDVMVSRSS